MKHNRFPLPEAIRLAVALLLLLAVGRAAPVPAQGGLSDEYEIRAAMVFNLPKFIQWPAWKMNGMHPVFELCELGTDPVTAILENFFRGKTIFEKPVSIRRLSQEEDASSCHLLYVTGSERKQFERISSDLRNKGVLCVGAEDWILTSGGEVSLPVIDNRVHIQIQITNAQKGGWTVSSKLLQLANIIH